MAILYTKTNLQRSVPRYAVTGSSSNINSNVSEGRTGRELRPTGNGWIDVIRQFPWTLTPKNSEAIKETPFIMLYEHYMIDSALNQQLKPYGLTTNIQGGGLSDIGQLAGQRITGSTDRLYEGLYDLIAPSGFKYAFPLFSPENFTLNNSWERKDILDTVIDFQKKGIGMLGSFARQFGQGAGAGQRLHSRALRGIARGAQTAANLTQTLPDILKQVNLLRMQTQNPAVGLFDSPQLWQGSTPRQYSFSFYLYNILTDSNNLLRNIILPTLPTGNTITDVNQLIKRNWELCYILTYQNLLNKANFFKGYVPVFYEVFIPGVHYCKASYMSNIQISNVGNVRKMRLDIDDGLLTDVNIPDAYKVDITMQDLLMPSKNLYDGVTSYSKRVVLQKPLPQDQNPEPAGN